MAVSRKLPVILEPADDGWFVATCPVIPGCVSQGESREAALRNIGEAIDLCLESMDEEGWSLPARFEVVEVDVPQLASK